MAVPDGVASVSVGFWTVPVYPLSTNCAVGVVASVERTLKE